MSSDFDFNNIQCPVMSEQEAIEQQQRDAMRSYWEGLHDSFIEN